MQGASKPFHCWLLLYVCHAQYPAVVITMLATDLQVVQCASSPLISCAMPMWVRQIT